MRIKLNIQKFASGTVFLGTSGKLDAQVVWSSTSNGSSANTSTVTVTIQVKRNDSGYTTTGTWNGNTVIAGIASNYSWYGSISNSWVNVHTQTETVRHNDDGTGSAQVGGGVNGPSGTPQAGNSISYSAIVTLDTIPRYGTSTQSLRSKTETSITMNWASDSVCDYVWYSINNGASWTAVGSTNVKNGVYTINGLTANSPYNIKTRIRRKDSQLTTDSVGLYVPTYNYPYAETMPNFNIGNSVTIGLYNPLGRQCTVTVYGADNSVIGTKTTNTTSTGAFLNDPTPIDNLYKSIPNSANGTYKVKVETSLPSSNTRTGGTYTAQASLCSPTFSNFTFEDINSTTLALTDSDQKAIVNYSTLEVTIPANMKATANLYASMVKYQYKVGNTVKDITYSSSEVVSERIDNITTGTMQVYAIDSRGFSTLVSKDVSSLLAYTNIVKDQVSIERQNNIGEAVTLTFNGTFWNNNFGQVSNAITSVTYRYKKTTEQNWTTGTTTIVPTISGNDYSFSGGIVGDIAGTGFDAGSSYNIEVTVNDRLSSTIFTTTLGSGSPNMAFVEGGISLLGKYDESDTTNKVQINGDTKISGNLTSSKYNNYEIDFLTNNTTDTWVPVFNGYKIQHREIPTNLPDFTKLLQCTLLNTTTGEEAISDNQTKSYQLASSGFYLFIDSHPYNNSIGIINGLTGNVKYMIETSGHLVFSYNSSSRIMQIRTVNGARFKLYRVEGQPNQ